MFRRRVPLFALAVVLVHGTFACLDDDLNPQPLPPDPGKETPGSPTTGEGSGDDGFENGAGPSDAGQSADGGSDATADGSDRG
jgi:hypothetical protein